MWVYFLTGEVFTPMELDVTLQTLLGKSGNEKDDHSETFGRTSELDPMYYKLLPEVVL